MEEEFLQEIMAPLLEMQAQQEQPSPIMPLTGRPQFEILQNTPENMAYQQQRREILNPAGQESYSSLSAKAAVDQLMQAQEAAKRKQEAELMQTVSKLDPQLQSAILKRAGIQVPDVTSKLDQQSALQRQQLLLKHKLEAPDRAANLALRQQEAMGRQEQRESQASMQEQLLELRKQSVLAQQASQLQKLQDMVALIPPTDPRRKVLEELILNSTMSLLPQFLGAQGGGEPAPNPAAPLEGPKITVRRKGATK